MKAYMGYDAGLGAEEGAVLIFANNAREAKQVGRHVVQSLFETEYMNVRVRLMRNADHLFPEADQEKLSEGVAHVIDSPKCCVRCECWGFPFDENGVCKACRETEKIGDGHASD